MRLWLGKEQESKAWIAGHRDAETVVYAETYENQVRIGGGGGGGCRGYGLVMSIGNKKFGKPRKYRYQIGFWYLCHKFLGIFFVCIVGMVFIKFGKILVFFVKIKIGLVFGFCGCHFIGIGLVLVCHFPESGISSTDGGDVPYSAWRLGVLTEWGCVGVRGRYEWGMYGHWIRIEGMYEN